LNSKCLLVKLDGTLVVENSEFIGNAYSQWPGIMAQDKSEISLTGVKMLGNKFSYLFELQFVTIEGMDLLFDSNTDEAFMVRESVVNLKNTGFVNHRNAITAFQSTLTLEKLQLENILQRAVVVNGGVVKVSESVIKACRNSAISVENSDSVVLNDIAFENSKAINLSKTHLVATDLSLVNSYGVQLSYLASSSLSGFTMTNSTTFSLDSSNLAMIGFNVSNSTNAIAITNSNATISDSSFVGNAANRGGAILLDGSNLEIVSSNFTSNEAQVDGGGAIFYRHSRVDVDR
jgi:hypothetical protein